MTSQFDEDDEHLSDSQRKIKKEFTKDDYTPRRLDH
jgi:hypothetical protein